MDWGTVVSTVTGAVIGVGATSLSDRSRWRREQSERRTAVKRELYAEYLAAVARTWSEIRAAVINSDEPWPERAQRAGHAYRSGRVYELRYQISITAPPDIVVLSDQVMRGIRDLVEDLTDGATFSDWADLRNANMGWFDAFDAMRARMRLDLDGTSHPLPAAAHEPTA
ncbi:MULTISPECIES: hypothetical protein [unclassified Streptomyces]|uniref:hypothetical protein n=1 Tax=unclassified Streptomyces TaxID=2593676 RepID=UPI000FFF29BE|nr:MULTISPECIES: hypothetical protein [unclassified Streptomyces]